MSRVDLPEEQRRDFYLYVDEFQNFATESFTTILSEARKYRLNLILAHQYIAQLDEKVRDAVFGNVGTIVAFRVGAEDAEFLEKEFSPEFSAQDLVNLPKFNIYVKLMIDGVASRPFSAKTLPPPEINRKSFRETIIKVSRERYGVPARIVEEKISKWAGFLGELPKIEKQNTSPPKLYDAICDLCKKWTKVTFPPDGKRPVYCKKCRKKIKKEVKENLVKKEPLPPQESDSLVVSLKNLPSRANVKPPERPSSKKVNFDSLKKALTEAFKKKT
jgi:CxxC-x17-CxxC domain-containing protein